jgi:beta propeller repeat protein
MTKGARQWRHLAVALAVLVAITGALPPPITDTLLAQEAPGVDRFTVTDARGNQSAARVDGRWVVYEDDRRSVDPTSTPTVTPTPVPPTQTPVVVTATPTPIVVTATPTPIDATATPMPVVVTATPTTAAHLPADGASLVALAVSFQVTGESDIRARNLETGEDRRITNGPNAREPDVSGDLAVWSELGSDGNWGIVIYDLPDRSVVRRIDRSGDQQYPAISGRLVVWQDSRRGNWDIRAYDIDERREFTVADSPENETRPAIDGDLVVFERDDQIWYRDLTTNSLERIEGYDGWEPDVSGDRVVFRTGDGRDDERNAGIYLFDRRDGSVVQLSTWRDSRRGTPRVGGDVVVWWARRRGDRDIFGYELTSRAEFQIDVSDHDQDQPAMSGADPTVVVWTDRRGSDINIRGARVRVTGPVAADPTPTPTPTPPTVVPVDPSPPAPRDARYFSPTGFRIDDDAIWSYFTLRGGVQNFGYPVSRTFRFLGFTTQIFQRHVVQIGPEGPRLVNLLDPELMPYTRINTSTFPAFDAALAEQAPRVGSPGYDTAILEFVRQHAPDTHDGQPVQFFQTFVNQVDLATAFPNGGGNPSLLPGFNLELAGTVTSQPYVDPNNASFIYQRFQRVILHYDAGCGCTQPILLADYFKSILMGEGLPPDLDDQARGSRFYGQYDNAAPNGVRRPDLLPSTDLRFAFERQ